MRVVNYSAIVPSTILCLLLYGILHLLLTVDPRIKTIISSRNLQRLGISKQTYLVRVSRYNDYLENEHGRSGPGEYGAAVNLHLTENEMDAIQSRYGYNKPACDLIALDRALSNRPAAECRMITYPHGLPTASVILIFFNEEFRPIIRTVHSVVNRSPPYLLKEVILLDDGSTLPALMEHLDNCVKQTWPDGIVRIVRMPQRLGLVRARQEGAKVSTGEVLVFLDAHCEATSGWLEPLLFRIYEEPKAVVLPSISNIDRFTMRFFRNDVTRTDNGQLTLRIGTFSWDGFHVFDHPSQFALLQQKRITDPIPSITMAGGLLALRTDYFFQLGGYDEGMEVWGGENLEMSFRIWQCGGRLETSPCSTVGHIYRATHPYGFPGGKDFHGINTVRMAEVWMDDYKELFYLTRSELRTVNYGNISQRKQLREELGCKSFAWFLKNVAPNKFVFSHSLFYGRVCNDQQKVCLRGYGVSEYRKLNMELRFVPVTLQMNSVQLFGFTAAGLLRKEWVCVRDRREHPIFAFSSHMLDLEPCPKEFDPQVEQKWWLQWQAEQAARLAKRRSQTDAIVIEITFHKHSEFYWIFDKLTGKFINAQTGLCIDASDKNYPRPKPCSPNSKWQVWNFTRS